MIMKDMKHIFGIFILSLSFISGVVAQQYNESNDFSYALKLYNEGFYDVAAQQFSSFINRYPGSERLPDAHYYYGEALYKLHEIQDARIEFQSLAVGFPDHKRAPQAWIRVGECYQKSKNYKEAAKAYETVKILYPQNALAPKGLLLAAEMYMKSVQLNRAEQIIREFLDRYLESPEYPQGRILYGKLLIKKGELEKAGNEFQKAAEFTSDESLIAETRLGQSQVFEKLGLRNRAIEKLQTVIKNYSGTGPGFKAILMLTQIYLEGREWDKAIDLLRTETDRFSDSAERKQLKMKQAQALFLKHDYFAARQILEELSGSANELNENITIRFYLACCHLEEKHIDKAVEGFTALKKEIEENDIGKEFLPVVLYNLATIHVEKGDFPTARRFVKDYQALTSTDQNAERLHRDLIKLAFKQNLLSSGVNELQQFRGAYPNSTYRDDLIYSAGRAFFNDRQYERSLIYFEQITDEFICSSKWDSSKTYVDFIEMYFTRGQQTGVEELAKLLGKMFTGEDRRKLMFELGKIYLEDLKEYQEASTILERYVEEASDSSSIGEGLYYLSESYLRLAEYNSFYNLPSGAVYEKALQSLKRAMPYVKYVPQPDTLTYRLLTTNLKQTDDPTQKYSKFWEHFEQNYPTSKLLPVIKWELGQAALATGDTSEAIEHFKQITLEQGNKLYSGFAAWQNARLFARQGNIDIAIQTLKDFLLNHPNHPYQARGYWQLALHHEEIEDYSTAAKFLERLLQLFDYSDFAEKATVKITDYYIRNNEYSKALTYVNARIDHQSESTDLIAQYYLAAPPAPFYFYAGKAYFQQNEFQKSRQYLLEYLNLAKEDALQPESLFLLGKMAEQERDYESALLHFALIKNEDNNPFFYQANKNAADILFNQGRYSEAFKKYDLLISQIPDVDKRIYYEAQKLRCLINQGNTGEFQSQLNMFERQYKNHPQKKTYLAAIEYERGKYSYSQKRFQGAIDHFDRVLGKYEKTEYADDAQYFKCRSFATMNRTEDALEELDEFFKKFPNSDLLGNVYLTQAEIFFRSEKSDLGLEAAKKAVENAANAEIKKSALSLLINSYRNLGLWDAALQRTREYINEFPEAEDLVSKKIAVGVFLTKLNRLTEAIDYLRRLKFEASSEEEPEIQYYIGEAYYNAGQYEKAINEFLKIPLLSKQTKLQWEASALYFAGQSYEKLGRTQDAKRMYQQIIERPGIQIEFKREARKLIDQLQN